MLEEFVLSEGRPGKETGHYEVVKKSYGPQLQNKASEQESSGNNTESSAQNENGIKEAEDEGSYRRVLEEVQRTFVYLDKGARGKVFDPRTLVEASGCLKLEFDIWQQNDASEYAMKLLDRLEVPLKRWSHSHFKHLEHTFRLKQTKQKIYKECGLTTNREENLMNIDCQIRGKEHI
jgi:ubiquitin carboxyl-terminal hydrolase 9/24